MKFLLVSLLVAFLAGEAQPYRFNGFQCYNPINGYYQAVSTTAAQETSLCDTDKALTIKTANETLQKAIVGLREDSMVVLKNTDCNLDDPEVEIKCLQQVDTPSSLILKDMSSRAISDANRYEGYMTVAKKVHINCKESVNKNMTEATEEIEAIRRHCLYYGSNRVPEHSYYIRGIEALQKPEVSPSA